MTCRKCRSEGWEPWEEGKGLGKRWCPVEKCYMTCVRGECKRRMTGRSARGGGVMRNMCPFCWRTDCDRPKLLDAFCGAGGAAMGYARAGFCVLGVDVKMQPHYPFRFHQGDALEFIAQRGHEFDAIHASPPCQAYVQRNKHLDTKHPRLIEPTREVLQRAGHPFVIENVPGAPLHTYTLLCGSMFGLRVLRHRLFETSFAMSLFGPRCCHRGTVASGDYAAVYGFGGKGHRRGAGVRDPRPAAGPDWVEAMGIDWMTRGELTQAIPPAYTEYIGKHLLAAVRGTAREGA